MGFRYVESGPLVRSSYHAHEHKPENAPKRLDLETIPGSTPPLVQLTKRQTIV